MQEKVNYTVVPSIVYTVPALGSVGLTEKAVREQGLDVDIHINDMREWFSGKTYVETVSWSKVLVDEQADRIRGAHIVCHHAEELIHLSSLAMQHDPPASKLKSSRYAFPTFAAVLPSMV